MEDRLRQARARHQTLLGELEAVAPTTASAGPHSPASEPSQALTHVVEQMASLFANEALTKEDVGKKFQELVVGVAGSGADGQAAGSQHVGSTHQGAQPSTMRPVPSLAKREGELDSEQAAKKARDEGMATGWPVV